MNNSIFLNVIMIFFLKDFTTISFLQELKEAFMYSQSIMIQKTVAYGRRLTWYCFDCIIKHAKFDVTQAFKSRMDIWKVTLPAMNDLILKLFHAILVVYLLKNDGQSQSLNCKPKAVGNIRR